MHSIVATPRHYGHSEQTVGRQSSHESTLSSAVVFVSIKLPHPPISSKQLEYQKIWLRDKIGLA